MPNYTKNLNLFKYDPSTDGSMPFDVQKALNDNWDVLDEKGAGSGFNLFDTKLVDHVLEGKEAEGWALQGTWVNKNAVAGSSAGYPDFYNKCLEEYTNATEKITLNYNVVQNKGILQNNTFTGASGAYLKLADVAPLNTAESWEFVTKYTHGTYATYGGLMMGSGSTYYGCPHILVKENIICFYLSSNDSSWDIASDARCNFTLQQGVTYFLKFGFDGTCYYCDYKTNTSEDYIRCLTINSTTRVTSNVPIMLMNHGYNTTTYSNYGTLHLLDTYLKINDEIWWEAITTGNKCSNGHIYYDIKQKHYVDNLYNMYGMAWYYGIDIDNERIFLPRNNWFEQVGGIDEVGYSVEAGLPNITGVLYSVRGCDGTGASEGALWNTAGATNGAQSGVSVSCRDIRFDASRSNPIYGASDTVQPNAVKKLLYICVGNVMNYAQAGQYTDVTTTDNDTIPLFTAQYFNFIPNNISWLKSNTTKTADGVYEFIYQELVNELTKPKYNLKVIDVVDMLDDVDYSFYWKIDQDNKCFTTPVAASICGNKRNLVAYKAATSSDFTWYNLYSDGWCEQGGYFDSAEVASSTVTLNLSYINTNYNVIISNQFASATNKNAVHVISVNTDKFSYYSENTNGNIYWKTEGYCEVPSTEDYDSFCTLYFKVGNAVQGLELINVGQLMENFNGLTEVNGSISMASTKYVNLQLGASGTRYTAPADGWVQFVKCSTATNQYINPAICDFYTGVGTSDAVDIKWSSAANQPIATYFPIRKNQNFFMYYSVGGDTSVFRFYYAVGSEWEA